MTTTRIPPPDGTDFTTEVVFTFEHPDMPNWTPHEKRLIFNAIHHILKTHTITPKKDNQ